MLVNVVKIIQDEILSRKQTNVVRTYHFFLKNLLYFNINTMVVYSFMSSLQGIMKTGVSCCITKLYNY